MPDSMAVNLKFLDHEKKHTAYEDGVRFLKPNKYFESQLDTDKIRVFPECVQYDAQYMMLVLFSSKLIQFHFSRFYASVLATVTIIPLDRCGDMTEYLQSRYIKLRKLINFSPRQKALCICSKTSPFWSGIVIEYKQTKTG